MEKSFYIFFFLSWTDSIREKYYSRFFFSLLSSSVREERLTVMGKVFWIRVRCHCQGLQVIVACLLLNVNDE